MKPEDWTLSEFFCSAGWILLLFFPASLSQESTTNFLYFAILRTLGPTQEFSWTLPEIHSGAGETTYFLLLFTFQILKHLFRSIKASSSEMLPPFQTEMIRCLAVYTLSKVGFGLTVSIKKKEIFWSLWHWISCVNYDLKMLVSECQSRAWLSNVNDTTQ